MKKILTLIVMACVTMGAWADDTWTVVGDQALTGYNWKPDQAENHMTSLGNGKWKWVRENVSLETLNYEFKIAKNDSWDEAYPGSNWQLKGNDDGKYFSAAGTYNVTIFFDETTHDINVILNGCTVAGSEALFGSSWNVSDTNNDMTLQDDGTYKLEKTGLSLNSGTNYEYKIVANHSWDLNYGANNERSGSNITLTPTYSGSLTLSSFDVAFSFVAAPVSVSATYTPNVTNVTLNENEDVATKIGQTCKIADHSITVNRTLHAGHWNTICLPFSMSSGNLEASFGSGWKLAKFTGCTADIMTFEQVDAADHNTPYLLWVPEAKGDMTTFTVTYDYIYHDNDRLTVNPDNAGYCMIGNLNGDSQTVPNGALFINNDKVYRSIGNSLMKAMSAYFTVPSESHARSFTFSVDGETTGIISIEKDGSFNVEESVYDLQGRKVTNPKHGLYIINGKKVMK